MHHVSTAYTDTAVNLGAALIAASQSPPQKPVGGRIVSKSCYLFSFGLTFASKIVTGLLNKQKPDSDSRIDQTRRSHPGGSRDEQIKRPAPTNDQVRLAKTPAVYTGRPQTPGRTLRDKLVPQQTRRFRWSPLAKLREYFANLTKHGTGIWEYAMVTMAYWGFTITDGALRMLVLLQFFLLGYSAFQIAFLFLFYEVFGVVTNLLGGWLGSNLGLRVTLFGGLGIQIVALLMLALLNPAWPVGMVVAYVMAAQALSGIAKDLTKMSSKSAIKAVVPKEADTTLYRWVSLLTGSKNALKGVGFFVGGLLLTLTGFTASLLIMGIALFALLCVVSRSLPKEVGVPRKKSKFKTMFSMDRRINVLSAARFFLFGARDIWFVVALPVYFSAIFGWSPIVVGGYLALWTIGYGIIQSMAPRFVCAKPGETPKGYTVTYWAAVLAAVPAAIALALSVGFFPGIAIVGGLAIFGVFFAINSAVHSYMIVHYAESEKVAMTVGFYYMANAGGRLAGTVLSGLIYQFAGIVGCLWVSAAFVSISTLISSELALPNRRKAIKFETRDIAPRSLQLVPA
jgi:hypothetical protein